MATTAGHADDPRAATHVLLVPYPAQGHINPLFQFAKILAGRHSLRCTLALTRYLLSVTAPPPHSSVRFAAISDGCDAAGFNEIGDVPAYLASLEAAGSATLSDLLESILADPDVQRAVVVYDPFLPWAAEVARRRGSKAVALFTQPCSVNVVYGHVYTGTLRIPVNRASATAELPGLSVALSAADLPTFIVGPEPLNPYVTAVVEQFKGLDVADGVLQNTFYELQPQEADYMASTWRATTVGPLLPSSFLDDDDGDDSDVAYGFDLVPAASPFMDWLDAKPPRSVVYVSFGSLNSLPQLQMTEIALGLLAAGSPFIWVVRAVEADKLPAELLEKLRASGIVLSWCPQLQVLAHNAVGCFLTHCGWNSTLEALASGVPLVGMPQWADQATNIKYIEDVWAVGIRARPDGDDGVVRSEEVERCVKAVLGAGGEEYRRKSAVYMEMAKTAARRGGSSHKNIADFVAKFAGAS